MKDKGKILDNQITHFLTNRDTKSIQELLDFDFSSEFDGSILDEKGLISSDFLRAIMIKRDQIVYRLKDIQMENGLSYEDVKDELELHPEESTYNLSMYDSKDITVVHANGKCGQPMTFYYYTPNHFNNDKKNMIIHKLISIIIIHFLFINRIF